MNAGHQAKFLRALHESARLQAVYTDVISASIEYNTGYPERQSHYCPHVIIQQNL